MRQAFLPIFAPILAGKILAFRSGFCTYRVVQISGATLIALGFQVWPKEVEDILWRHPAVRETAMIGMDDFCRSQTVKAVVNLKPRQSLGPKALIAYCKERMAAYQYPRLAEIIDELPKTVIGKVLRRALC